MELTYARWLGWCTRIALITLIVTFLAYAFALAQPLVPLDRLPALWQLPVDEFLAATGAPTGWGWLAQVGSSDYMNMVGVAMLCLVSLLCYVRLLFCRGEALVRVVVLAQVLVLVCAASGVLAGGH